MAAKQKIFGLKPIETVDSYREISPGIWFCVDGDYWVYRITLPETKDPDVFDEAIRNRVEGVLKLTRRYGGRSDKYMLTLVAKGWDGGKKRFMHITDGKYYKYVDRQALDEHLDWLLQTLFNVKNGFIHYTSLIIQVPFAQ